MCEPRGPEAFWLGGHMGGKRFNIVLLKSINGVMKQWNELKAAEMFAHELGHNLSKGG